jgi:beta-glucanase (GH16 family)
MKVFIMICIYIIANVSENSEQSITPEDKNIWNLVWQDEFDYETKEDLLKTWESQNASNTHILCSRWEENIEVGKGTVRLVNRKEHRSGQDWTSGSIWTRKDFQYGYFECRYKYASETGTNNSFWLMSRQEWVKPFEGKRFEIDVNEGHYPNEINTNIHNWTDISVEREGKNIHPTSHKAFCMDTIDFSREYHLFGLEWNKDELIFYLDRNEIRREKNTFCLSPVPVFLSLAIITWAGEVTDRIDGTFMEVDYVRVYQRKECIKRKKTRQ